MNKTLAGLLYSATALTFIGIAQPAEATMINVIVEGAPSTETINGTQYNDSNTCTCTGELFVWVQGFDSNNKAVNFAINSAGSVIPSNLPYSYPANGDPFGPGWTACINQATPENATAAAEVAKLQNQYGASADIRGSLSSATGNSPCNILCNKSCDPALNSGGTSGTVGSGSTKPTCIAVITNNGSSEFGIQIERLNPSTGAYAVISGAAADIGYTSSTCSNTLAELNTSAQGMLQGYCPGVTTAIQNSASCS